MKKIFLASLFVILMLGLFSSFAYSADENSSMGNSSSASLPIDKLKADSNKLSTAQIPIPGWADSLLRFIFKFDLAEELTLQKTIIILSLWIMLIILIYKVLSLFEILGQEGWVRYAEAIIIGLLVAISGGLTMTYFFFFGLLDFVSFLQDWFLLKGAIVLVIFVMFFLGFSHIIKNFEKRRNIMSRNYSGVRVGMGS
ncbi:MAG: hypothetical protein Q8Q31_02200 [Nanoarchaeota archaeon]|nr:hypothetical protein [Nanoarchaeota archaeon]